MGALLGLPTAEAPRTIPFLRHKRSKHNRIPTLFKTSGCDLFAGQVSWRLKTSRRFAASHPEEQTVKRECAGTSHHNRQGESQHQKVVLNAFARLFAEPVHEESVLRVHPGDRDDHVAGDPQSSDPAE